MVKKVRVYELARELGLNNSETLELSRSLGIGVTSASSSMEEPHADRVRRKAEREGLRRESTPDESSGDTKAKSDAPKAVVSSKKPPKKAKPAPGAKGAKPPTGPGAKAQGGSAPGDAKSQPRPKPGAGPKGKPKQQPRQPNRASAPMPTPKTPPPGQQRRPRPKAPPAGNVVKSSGSPQRPQSPPRPKTPPPAPPQGQRSGPKPAGPEGGQRPQGQRGEGQRGQRQGSRPQGQRGEGQRPQGQRGEGQRGPRPQDQRGQQGAPRDNRDQRGGQKRRPRPDQGASKRDGKGRGRHVPRSASGKPIPPPPGPPVSASGKPIPPPPGLGGRGPAPTRGGGSGRPGSGGGGDYRPSSGPPSGRGRPSGPGRPNQRPQRRRRRGRRRRSLEELRPVDTPQYTPDGAAVPEGTIIIERHSTPQDVGPKLNRTAADIVRFFLMSGDMVMTTQSLTDEQVTSFAESIEAEVRIVDPGEEREEEMRSILGVEELTEREGEVRPPVITVMGHVDHGKTKLLDTIRDANVGGGEAGGITQKIGAYQVEHNGSKLTFIDTPGHAAFTAIRARGAEATDIVVLVVAADDGVMPQTIEAINHAQVAEVPIIVAINKMDREGANPDKVSQQLSEYNLIPEEWGGDTVMVKISALKGEGIDELLDAIALVAEVEELTAAHTGRAAGVVLESNLEVGRGPVATILVQQGLIEVGEPIVAGDCWGRVRALTNDRGKRVDSAGPSTPVEVLGLNGVPRAGDDFVIAQDEKTAAKVAETREHYRRVASISRDGAAAAQTGTGGFEDLFSNIASQDVTNLALILRADTHGSLEALQASLAKVERPEVKIRFLHTAVGAPTENDVQLAQAADATVIGFNVRPDRSLRTFAEQEGVEIRTYEVIYDVIDDIEKAVVGLLEPEIKEVVTGEAEVREIFRVRQIGAVAGCYVREGVIKRNDKVRFLRDGVVIWHGTLTSLKRFTEDATEVRSGFECGVGLSDFQDLQQGDIIETYEEQEIAPS